MNLPNELAKNLIEYMDLAYFFSCSFSTKNNKDYYLQFYKKFAENYFTEEWSKGGTSGNCWNDDIHEMSGDDEPEFIYQLTDFLSQYYSELTPKEINHIYSYVEYSESSVGDYYGGREERGHKTITLKNLAYAIEELVYSSKKQKIIDFDKLVQEHSNWIIHTDADNYHKFALKGKLEDKLSDVNLKRPKLKI